MSGSKFISDRLFSLSKGHLSSTVMRLAVTSVALAIAVMLISLAVVVGFKHQIRDKVVGFVAPIHIQALDRNESYEEQPFVVDERLSQALDKTDGIKHYQMVANKAGMIKTDEEIQGVVMKGVGADYDWNYFKDYLVEGVVPQYVDGERSNDVMLSKNIANKLLLSVGDPARVWFIDEDMQARGRKFNVVGIYETGLSEFDERYVFCDLDQIRRLNHWEDNETGLVEVWIDDMDAMADVNNSLYFSIPGTLASYTARESNPQIFDWLDLLDTNVWLILVLMFLVAGITVISMLLIIIIEKTSTIGLLKAMGASDAFVRKVFMQRSIRILLIGMLIGNVIGIGFCLLQRFTGFIHLNPATYYLSSVPIELHLVTVLLLNAGTFVLWILMLLIPTSIINRIRPSKSIRFE
ncbi:MAG: ABC transporter permease [Bacteroidales bacterium]|nr:ABC transporter permease [Bacteroidales bacterium]MBR5081597.1 ABC transporter permease [Bacteroidales bacterium]